MMIDLHDWQVGSLCSLCGDHGEHKTASLSDSAVGPVCDDCMVECLRAERVMRDSMKGAA